MSLRKRKTAAPDQPLWEFHDAGAGGPKRVVRAPTLALAVTKLAFELDALGVTPLDDVRGWKFREAKVAPGLRADVVYQAWTPPGETEPEREPPAETAPAVERTVAPSQPDASPLLNPMRVDGAEEARPSLRGDELVPAPIPQYRDSGIRDRTKPETLRGQFGDASIVVLPERRCACSVKDCPHEWTGARKHPEHGWRWLCEQHLQMDWEEIDAEEAELEFVLT